jgi:hypothetical protein
MAIGQDISLAEAALSVEQLFSVARLFSLDSGFALSIFSP